MKRWRGGSIERFPHLSPSQASEEVTISVSGISVRTVVVFNSMKNIKDLFDKDRIFVPTKKSRRTERGDLVTAFTERLNKDRQGTKYKPLTIAYVASLLSKMRVFDLYRFHKECEQANNFSSLFWYKIKQTKK
jgi:hypothetical protein